MMWREGRYQALHIRRRGRRGLSQVLPINHLSCRRVHFAGTQLHQSHSIPVLLPFQAHGQNQRAFKSKREREKHMVQLSEAKGHSLCRVCWKWSVLISLRPSQAPRYVKLVLLPSPKEHTHKHTRHGSNALPSGYPNMPSNRHQTYTPPLALPQDSGL